VLRVPRIDQTQALTTVSAQSGQTIVLSGLLTTRKVDAHRRVPLVGDIPLIGDLFRYDAVNEEKRELLIVLTPQVVYTPEDGERLKRIESSRMSWILRDVVALHGEAGLRSRCDEWYEGEVDALYPGGMPTEGQILPMHEGEMLPGTPLLEQPGMQQPGIQPPRLQPTPPMGAPPGGAPPIPTPPFGGGASLNRQEASQNVATLRYDEPRPAAAKIQGTNIAPPLRLPSTD
jgi:hypothetical protein